MPEPHGGRAQAEALWARQQHANERNYAGFPLHSCSVIGHRGASAFRQFILQRANIEERVLDIGCGPQPVPSYLEGWPLSLVHGIDPLPPTNGPHPFTFVQGRAEQLPWADGYFTTVVAATSLDHVVDPAQVLREARRVLRPGGRLFIWCTLWAGADPYDPESPPSSLADDCHAYHLGDWFLRELERSFTVVEHGLYSSGNDFLEGVPR